MIFDSATTNGKNDTANDIANDTANYNNDSDLVAIPSSSVTPSEFELGLEKQMHIHTHQRAGIAATNIGNSESSCAVQEEVQAQDQEQVYDYLTLGDGDFTYSLDLCRFLQVQTSLRLAVADSTATVAADKAIVANAVTTAALSKDDTDANINTTPNIINVICSGIDSLNDLHQKYHDATFTLKKIASLQGPVPLLSLSLPHKIQNKYKKVRCSIDMDTDMDIGKDSDTVIHKGNMEKDTNTSCATTAETVKATMNISVHHCVNAIDSSSFGLSLVANENGNVDAKFKEHLEPEPKLPNHVRFKQVIFNHPHGTYK